MTHEIDNREHNNELPSQHTFEIKEEPKTIDTPPTKLEIKKEHKQIKSSISFTDKEIINLKSGVGFYNLNLESGSEEDKATVVSCIEDRIKLKHSTFLKDFREFKKNQNGITQSFLNDFFIQCEMKIEEDKDLTTKGNLVGKKALQERMIKHINSGDLSETEMLLLQVLFPKQQVSEVTRQAQYKSLINKK
ncbi:hypothetical protein AB4521_23375 [Vibrio cyclitrophicus]